ncbi:hypothetical protein QFZ23_002101 [Arthrobacter globiformis]|uniref:hypothetical protein n=1 Tax=Arthrobacter globiformis TaxID=1665 RepID=UPI002788215C|nr:hypothetical protein [Arthrobacter globiformis]MDQ1058200.1 hypothetical protein [Arthrobacter globiformis]
MNESPLQGAPSPGGAGHARAVHAGNHGTLSARQLRAVGRRRRDAEKKLEQHQRNARHKAEPENGADDAPARQWQVWAGSGGATRR